MTIISYHTKDGEKELATIVAGSLVTKATRLDGFYFAKIHYDFDFVLVMHKKITPTPTALNFYPLSQGSDCNRVISLTDTVVGNNTRFDTIKRTRNPVQWLRDYFTNSDLPGVAAQQGNFVLTESSFDLAYMQLNYIIF